MRLDFSQDDNSENTLSMVIRVGEVTIVDAATHKAAVTFDDDDGQTSGMLPVLIPNTLENHDHCLPDIGEDVLCLFLPTGTEEGFILGSFYAGNVTTPESSADVRAVTFRDGTRLAYDRSTHKLTARVNGDIEIAATGNIKATSSGTIELQAAGSVSIRSGGNVTITGTSLTLGQ